MAAIFQASTHVRDALLLLVACEVHLCIGSSRQIYSKATVANARPLSRTVAAGPASLHTTRTLLLFIFVFSILLSQKSPSRQANAYVAPRSVEHLSLSVISHRKLIACVNVSTWLGEPFQAHPAMAGRLSSTLCRSNHRSHFQDGTPRDSTSAVKGTSDLGTRPRPQTIANRHPFQR